MVKTIQARSTWNAHNQLAMLSIDNHHTSSQQGMPPYPPLKIQFFTFSEYSTSRHIYLTYIPGNNIMKYYNGGPNK